VSLQYLDNL